MRALGSVHEGWVGSFGRADNLRSGVVRVARPEGGSSGFCYGRGAVIDGEAVRLAVVKRGRGGRQPGKQPPLYVQVEKRIEELLVRGRYRVGDRIPPEAELVKSLGVSRLTVRAGLARLVERGLLERRQGSGTFLTRLPGGEPRSGAMGIRLGSIQADLGKLETFSMMAEKMGLDLGCRDLRIEATRAGRKEAAALEVSEGSSLAKVSRVLLVEGKPVAWMLDYVPEEIMPAGRISERFRPDEMLLDLLVSEGIPVGFSEVSVEAEMILPEDPVGEALGIRSPSAALLLTETVYLQTDRLTDDRPVQWSRDVFLPGTLNLYVVRELLDGRDPSLVFRFPAER